MTLPSLLFLLFSVKALKLGSLVDISAHVHMEANLYHLFVEKAKGWHLPSASTRIKSQAAVTTNFQPTLQRV